MKSHLPPDRKARVEQLGYDYAGQPKELVRQCNLCRHERLVHLTHVDRYGYPARASACGQCGLTFLNPVMTRAAYTDFYARIYRPLVSAYHNRLIDARTIQDEQRAYAAELIEFLAPWLADGACQNMLDIGGSTGVVAMAVAGHFKLKAAVLDPAAAELDWAARAGIDTIAGFLEDYEPQGREFDLILLCQTIDHLTDASGSLRKIRRLLRPGGRLFVDIVDFRAAYLRNGAIEGAVKIDHPFYFTEETCEAMLARSGFSVLEKNYAPDHLHVGYLCALAEPHPAVLPEGAAVREFFREIRQIQNGKA